jgi:hypothetical protein
VAVIKIQKKLCLLGKLYFLYLEKKNSAKRDDMAKFIIADHFLLFYLLFILYFCTFLFRLLPHCTEFNNLLPRPPHVALFILRLSFFILFVTVTSLFHFFLGGGRYGGLLERQGRDLLHVAIIVYQYTLYI